MAEERSDRFTEVEDRYAGYQVYDQANEKVGKVDDLFLNERDEPEYIGVKMGFLGTRSTLIPFEIARVDDGQQTVVVASDKDTIKDGPSFDDDSEISYDLEEQVYRHYGLDFGETPENGGETESSYGPYYGGEYSERGRETADGDSDAGAAGAAGPGMTMGDRESGEFREHPPEDEGVGERESDVEDEDELRVGRTEEELEASKRERETGEVNVRKRVHTERERMTVPKRREQVKVERVQTSGEAPESEIGEDEVRMPVTEEEVEVTKRPVQKEEIRVRKEAVEDEEVVEEDLRKEEVEVEDESEEDSDASGSR